MARRKGKKTAKLRAHQRQRRKNSAMKKIRYWLGLLGLSEEFAGLPEKVQKAILYSSNRAPKYECADDGCHVLKALKAKVKEFLEADFMVRFTIVPVKTSLNDIAKHLVPLISAFRQMQVIPEAVDHPFVTSNREYFQKLEKAVGDVYDSGLSYSLMTACAQFDRLDGLRYSARLMTDSPAPTQGIILSDSRRSSPNVAGLPLQVKPGLRGESEELSASRALSGLTCLATSLVNRTTTVFPCTSRVTLSAGLSNGWTTPRVWATFNNCLRSRFSCPTL